MDSQQLSLQLDHQVDVRAMAEGSEGCCAEPRKPLDGGGLTKVALLSPVDEALIFSGVDRGSIHGIDPTRSEFTRGTLNVPEV